MDVEQIEQSFVADRRRVAVDASCRELRERWSEERIDCRRVDMTVVIVEDIVPRNSRGLALKHGLACTQKASPFAKS
ncbi:hypothetical protein E3N88_36536 [Mikania micrantha]|uniref:Uncharacterized protein n=1 Tax=Mikania micrantha TaxID=192012 RepID=A0A5N6M507_9ASTR|nr:hypothetical protein E3N88_36536 [Mikania micrantha]